MNTDFTIWAEEGVYELIEGEGTELSGFWPKILCLIIQAQLQIMTKALPVRPYREKLSFLHQICCMQCIAVYQSSCSPELSYPGQPCR